jgi:hypothetical protein
MRRGRLPASGCRHVRVDGLKTLSGRNASPPRDHPIEHHVAGPEPTEAVDRSKPGRPRAQSRLSHRALPRTAPQRSPPPHPHNRTTALDNGAWTSKPGLSRPSSKNRPAQRAFSQKPRVPVSRPVRPDPDVSLRGPLSSREQRGCPLPLAPGLPSNGAVAPASAARDCDRRRALRRGRCARYWLGRAPGAAVDGWRWAVPSRTKQHSVRRRGWTRDDRSCKHPGDSKRKRPTSSAVAHAREHSRARPRRMARLPSATTER